MKGFNAVAPLAVALGATAVSASAVPDSLIPSYFKRATVYAIGHADTFSSFLCR